MWRKIKDFKCQTLVKYYFAGIILAVIVYHFTTNSIYKQVIDFSFLFEKEFAVSFIAALSGAFGGGFVYLIMMINNIRAQNTERAYWTKMKEKPTAFIIRNLVGFSLGALVYKLIMNMFELTNDDNLFKALFANNLIIDYVGMILAATAFSILISIGMKKRLKLLYGE